MPTYDYECKKCGLVFEAFHAMTAPPLKQCIRCKGRVQKMPGTGSGVIFKGSGFYETDYKRKDGKLKDMAGNEGQSSAGTTKSESGSSSSTPAAVASSVSTAPATKE